MVPVDSTKPEGDKHLGLITPEWQRARAALAIPPGHANVEIYADGMEVGVARCAAVQTAIDSGLKYLFFIDWDTLIPADSLLKLCYFLDNNPDYDIASGLYVMKTIPTFPLLWTDWNQGVDFDWTLGDVIKEGVVGIPMGCCLLRLSMFDNLSHTTENPWFQTVNKPVFCGGQWGRMQMTEDLWFTKRYTDEIDKERKRIMVDTSIWCEHICHTTGRRYTLGEDSLPMKRYREKNPISPVIPDPNAKKYVLHVGCGTAPLPAGKFDGFEEIRLDIDPAVNPDITGSITDIPLQDAMVDAIYSSHNLEHLSDHEVPKALSEFYRVLKHGGNIIIEVPDVQSVAEAIPKIGMDGVLYQSPAGPISPSDVLYGLRSAVSHGNTFYAHKTGFTKESLGTFLTKAQYKNVTVDRNPESFALFACATRP
jgi:SAM-dependent methyltransferase